MFESHLLSPDKGYYIEENTGGAVLIRRDSSSSCIGLGGGNPTLDMQGLTSLSINYISLPSSLSFQSIAPILLTNRQEQYGGESLKLLSDLFSSNPQQCNSFQRGNYTNTFGVFSNGGYARYLGFVKLAKNTIESPILDGGLQAKNDMSYYCQNAPATYQNSTYVFFIDRPSFRISHCCNFGTQSSHANYLVDPLVQILMTDTHLHLTTEFYYVEQPMKLRMILITRHPSCFAVQEAATICLDNGI